MCAYRNATKNHIARGVGRLADLVFTSGKGSYVQTSCGKSLLDFTTGIGVVNTGHSHPRVVAAAKEQVENIVHSQVNIGYHDKMLELTEMLLPHLPNGMDKMFYGTTGAEAVENAVKMARAFTGKHAIVVFRGGYHGRTMGTMAMTVSIGFMIIYKKVHLIDCGNSLNHIHCLHNAFLSDFVDIFKNLQVSW